MNPNKSTRKSNRNSLSTPTSANSPTSKIHSLSAEENQAEQVTKKQQFRSVQSPLIKSFGSPSKYNHELTGNHRVLNDTIVDFHRIVSEWRSKHSSGFDYVLKLQDLSRESREYDETCTIIRQILEDMKILVKKLSTYADRLDNLSKLQNIEKEKPYSLSWGCKEFANCAKHIADAYSTETDMKYSLIIGIVAQTRNYALVAAIWDVVTVDEVLLEFETMLYEAKLKQ